jgi:hypothetical protein
MGSSASSLRRSPQAPVGANGRAPISVYYLHESHELSAASLQVCGLCMAPVRRAREEHHSTMNGTAQMERVCGCPNHKHIISAAARARMCCVSLCETRLTARLTYATHAAADATVAQRASGRSLALAYTLCRVRRASFFAKSFSSCSPPAPLRSRETRRRGAVWVSPVVTLTGRPAARHVGEAARSSTFCRRKECA